MSTILKNRNISFSTKLKVLKTYVWSILLYGCETWTITAGTKKNLEAAEMWFYRRMLRISWKEKRTNESILEETNQERSLIKTIRKRQLKFLGHICRHKGLEFLSLTGKIEGTRSRGRQRITFLDSLSSFVTGNNKDNIALLRMTEDRDRWRIMIADVCSRQGIWEREIASLAPSILAIKSWSKGKTLYTIIPNSYESVCAGDMTETFEKPQTSKPNNWQWINLSTLIWFSRKIRNC